MLVDENMELTSFKKINYVKDNIILIKIFELKTHRMSTIIRKSTFQIIVLNKNVIHKMYFSWEGYWLDISESFGEELWSRKNKIYTIQQN